MGPLTVNATGVLLMAPGEPLTASHRHHSQLMAIHPLGLLHPENSADDRRIVDATLADLDRLGTSAWRDTSFRDLRAEGGFVVSAEQRDDRLRRVSIRATVEQELRLADPFSGRPCVHNLPVMLIAGEIRCRLRPGQTLELSEPAPSRAGRTP